MVVCEGNGGCSDILSRKNEWRLYISEEVEVRCKPPLYRVLSREFWVVGRGV